MSVHLDKARRQVAAGQYKAAVDSLLFVEPLAREGDHDEAEGMRELCLSMDGRLSGGARDECDRLKRVADDALSKATAAASAEPIRVLLPAGSTVNVVGESHYQPTLESIAGDKTQEGCDCRRWAELVREPENPYDRTAIAVQIDGQCVGYLSREDAAGYGWLVEHLRDAFSARAMCEASIVGGWHRIDGSGRIDEGQYGVRLALSETQALVGTSNLAVLSDAAVAAGPPLEGYDATIVLKVKRVGQTGEILEAVGSGFQAIGCLIMCILALAILVPLMWAIAC